MVVPVYNVEKYLAECVESILSQTRDILEVILIDDGSTDSSGAIADSFAAKDSRVRVIRQENHGPGATRNLGIDQANGFYVMFIDSDDVVPPRAIEKLFRAAEAGKADFAVGRYQRMRDGERLPVRQWMIRATPSTAIGVAPSDRPEVVATITTPTKLFRRGFLISSALRYPEGVYTEDQLFAAKVYSAAERISIIPEVIYFYRQRSEETSITDNKAQPKHLADMCEQTRLTIDYYRDHAPELEGAYRRYLLTVLYPSIIKGTFGAGGTQLRQFQETCAYVMGLGSEDDLEAASSTNRTVLYFAIQGSWDLVALFEDFLAEYSSIPPCRVVGGHVITDFREFTELQDAVPEKCALRSTWDSRLIGSITDISLDMDTLQVEFFAAIRGLGMPTPAGELDVELTNAAGDKLASNPKLDRVGHSELPDQLRSHANVTYAGSLVRATFAAAGIPESASQDLPELRLRVMLTQEGVTRSGVPRLPRTLVPP